jgi:hypothetical protein
MIRERGPGSFQKWNASMFNHYRRGRDNFITEVQAHAGNVWCVEPLDDNTTAVRVYEPAERGTMQ